MTRTLSQQTVSKLNNPKISPWSKYMKLQKSSPSFPLTGVMPQWDLIYRDQIFDYVYLDKSGK